MQQRAECIRKRQRSDRLMMGKSARACAFYSSFKLTTVVPVVERGQYEHVPPVVRVANVVDLSGEPSLRYSGDIDQEGRPRE